MSGRNNIVCSLQTCNQQVFNRRKRFRAFPQPASVPRKRSFPDSFRFFPRPSIYPFVKAKPVFTLGIEEFRVLIFRGNIKPSCHNLFYQCLRHMGRYIYGASNQVSWTDYPVENETGCFSRVSLKSCLRYAYYLTIIPRARMGSESIAHEAEGSLGNLA